METLKRNEYSLLSEHDPEIVKLASGYDDLIRRKAETEPICNNVARYRHYKGGEYELISYDVIHTETGERLVVYKNLRGQVFARPQEQFYGIVETEEGKKVPRFVLI